MLPLKRILLANAPLKIVSLIIGYTFWYIFGHAHTVTTKVQVPVCFYGTSKAFVINSPDTITVELTGKRSHLHSLDLPSLALHINAQKLQVGPNPIEITSATLFLPESIKLINYSPSNMVINVTHSSELSQT